MTDRAELPLDRARTVVLIDAIERTDPRGDWLPLPVREDATRHARAALGEEPEPGKVARAIAGRAERLLNHLTPDDPALGRVARGLSLGLLISLAALVPILYGLGRSVLGSGDQIDLFKNPLVLLIAWNAFVATIAIVFGLLPRRRRRASGATPSPTRRAEAPPPPLLSTRLGEWLLAVGIGVGGLRAADRAGAWRRAMHTFVDRWRQIAAVPLANSARLMLHTGALLLLSSAIAEAYLRGLFTEYDATWESTFLSPEQAESLATVLYGLPAALLGREVTLPSEPTPAAPWIHLLALAAVLFAVLPRLYLLGRTIIARRGATSISVPIEPALSRRLGARAVTGFARVEVTPYSCRVPEGGADRLRALLVEILGERAVIELADPVPYGVEDLDDHGSPAEEWCHIVLFALAQPPELEVHGAFLNALAGRDGPVAVVIDGSGLVDRFGNDAEGLSRVAERRRAWDRALEESGRVACHVDLGRDLGDDAFSDLGRALAATREEGRR